MNAVERLCQRVMWLERGSVAGIYGDAREGILAYLKSSVNGNPASVWRRSDGWAMNDYFVPQEFHVSSANLKAPADAPLSNQFDIIVDITGQILISDPALNIGIALYEEGGTLLFWSFTTDGAETNWPKLKPGGVHLRLVIPHRLLNESTYHVELLASLHHSVWLLEPGRNAPMVSFSIQGGLSDSPFWDLKRPGLLGPLLRWESRQDAAQTTASGRLHRAQRPRV